MSTQPAYPKRLIEVDLPIKQISAHARREKSIRHGHISTLHIWWARRPLAACRAVILAALWPDPADPLCPERFREESVSRMKAFADKRGGPACSLEEPLTIRTALLDFIARFANWDHSAEKDYLETARALVQVAHESLGGEPGTRPLVVDPFAGGGAIPLEAFRVGADAFASDLNPVAVLLNKVVLEYIPKYGQQLADEVRKWGEWIKKEAEKELAQFYPKDPDGATPIAYVWARTIRCEGPGCGAEVPLIRSLWLAKKRNRSVALRIVPNSKTKRIDFEIIEQARAADVGEGTVRRGSTTCPVCAYTTKVDRVKLQLKERRGGSADARLLCVVLSRAGQQGRSYRTELSCDSEATSAAAEELASRSLAKHEGLSLVPDEFLDVRGIRHTWAMLYGLTRWGDLFTPRQALALSVLGRLISGMSGASCNFVEGEFGSAIRTLLALALSKQTDLSNALCRWKPDAECPVNLFGRQAIPMIWDFAESVPTSDSSGSWSSAFDRTAHALDMAAISFPGYVGVEQCSATAHVLPDDAASALITDPPYYDSVPYAYLADFFYVWLRRVLGATHPGLFVEPCVPKEEEIVVDRPHELSNSKKDVAFYERELTRAFAEGRRLVQPTGIATVVFASKTTASWEAILKAIVEAGWTITGSWPIDTEMESRVAAQGQARLASSIHLACRPRGQGTGKPSGAIIGDWRNVLSELPPRMHDWMPRLAQEGVVGADALFACLGPALEIFSRYDRVEKASGEQVTLKEYLEHVWAAVEKEALTMIFAGADATGFEEDARLTAMWLWTLSKGESNEVGAGEGEVADPDEEDEDTASAKGSKGGFALEFDAARKLAQGLGVHLEVLGSLVEVKGDTARLLAVSERTRALFGKEDGSAPSKDRKKKKDTQLKIPFAEVLEEAEQEASWGAKNSPPLGKTILDRVHQSMILFAAARGEALKRFLVEDGAGRDERFWRLAQALSALYPSSTEEKRWVDGLLARKKGLGF